MPLGGKFSLLLNIFQYLRITLFVFKKSGIRETLNLSTNADSSTDNKTDQKMSFSFFGGSNIFLGGRAKIQQQKMSTRSVHKKCPQKVFTKSVHKTCPQNVSKKSVSKNLSTKSVNQKCPKKVFKNSVSKKRKGSGR